MMKNYKIISLVLFMIVYLGPVLGDDFTKSYNHVYIATFNVYKLGAVDPKYKTIQDWDATVSDVIPERVENLADVIAYAGFHLIAIQELYTGPKGYFAIKDLQKALRENHNMHYRFFISDYIGKGLIPESIAFLYRAHKVKYKRIDGERSVNIEIPGRDMVKTNWVAGDFDFTLISAHLAWGNESHRDAGYEKIKDIYDNPGNYSTDPDILIVGDFNRFGKGYESIKKLTYDSSKFLCPNVTFFDPQFSVKKNVTSASINGKGIPDDNPQLLSTTVAKNKRVYDMIMFSIDAAEEFPPGSNQAVYEKDFGIIHFDEVGGTGYQQGAELLPHNDLKEAFTDHRPLWIRFKTNNDEYDGSFEVQ